MLTFLSALVYRWRGAGHLAWGRILCAALVALPVAATEWPWGLAAYLPVGVLAWAALCLPHNPNPERLPERLLVALTGLAFTGAPALALAALGHWTAAAALALAGLAKGLCTALPKGPSTLGKFFWRELAFGASWGAALDLSLLLEVLS